MAAPSPTLLSSSHTPCRSPTTSPPQPSPQSLPRAPAQEAGRGSRPQTPSSPGSPTWSTASTADAGPSPSLPALPAPQLPERVAALLRTPPGESGDESRFVTASWGSPYPRSDTSHLRLSSLSSEPSEDSPIHHLEIHTPFLRPAPLFPGRGDELEEEDGESDGSLDEDLLPSPPFATQPSSSLVSATVLANRARRPARGLTEDWIRQHTTGDFGSEARLWLSDNSSTGNSENSSLSGSVSGNDRPAEDDELALRTPRAALANRHGRSPSSLASSNRPPHRKRPHHPRHPSSIETLRESVLNRVNRRAAVPTSNASVSDTCEPARETVAMDASSAPVANGAAEPAANSIAEPAAAMASGRPAVGESAGAEAAAAVAPATPQTKPATGPHAPALESAPLPALSTPPSKASPNRKRGSDDLTPQVPLDPLGELAVSKTSASPRKMVRRARKKLPWNGKSIIILLPIDEHRGKPGRAPKPLSQDAVENMLHSWEELGYDTQGFDLDRPITPSDTDSNGFASRSMSRPSWPDERDIAHERALRKYPIQLPDLNAWKNYVEELNEAKLRALGVSFGDEEPPLPPFSPGPGASISRQSSAPVYPPLPFSPPIPTSSASSSHGAPPFTFPAAFVPGAAGGFMGTSIAQSPSLPSTSSPIPFGGGAKYNARQSISIPAGVFQMPPLQTTPGGFSPQALLLQQGLVRGGSPSLAALSSVMSPSSPFTPDGAFTSPPLHQRHQSLQYPVMQYTQLQTSARASPRLQDLREVEEELDEQTAGKSPSKTPEPNAARPFVQHNASLSLQKEIDDAEYHLEEQFRSQFEHDRDYSPHGGKGVPEAFSAAAAAANPIVPQHTRGHSVQFATVAPSQHFRDDGGDGLVLHHPRPHSRGHSLANAYYTDSEDTRNSAGEGGAFSKTAVGVAPVLANGNVVNGGRPEDSYEVETNPSNLGTPVQGMEYTNVQQQQQQESLQKQAHQRAFSTTSNPWSDSSMFSGKRSSVRQTSHGSKASLSNLNVEAPEFKFNPASAAAFQPTGGSQFLFGNNPGASDVFQPSIFQAGIAPAAPLSANSSQFSFPTSAATSSKINVNAPTFSPGLGEFNFSAIGPKFRPDAPAFTPIHSFSDSLTSPIQSGSESINGGNRTSSIFGNIDLNIPDIVKPAKRSKAVPIVRPSSGHSPKPAGQEEKENEPQYDGDGRITDDSRVKRARAATEDDNDDEVLFAEPSNNALTVSSAEPLVAPETEATVSRDAGEAAAEEANHLASEAEAGAEAEVEAEIETEAEPKNVSEEPAEPETVQTEADPAAANEASADVEKPHDGESENAVAAEDTMLSSTILSESTDAAKLPATSTPSDLSPLPGSLPWAPFEFRSDADVADFNSARPMDEDIFRHKKSLSATAKPFLPGASFQGSVVNDVPDEFMPFEDILPTTEVAEEDQHDAFEPSFVPREETITVSSPPPPPPPAAEKPRGLAASRYAMPSPPPPPPKSSGLFAPRLATPPPPPVPSKDTEPAETAQLLPEQQLVMPAPEGDLAADVNGDAAFENAGVDYEPTFEEIDDIMRHLNENDPAQGVNKILESPPWHQPTPALAPTSLAAAASQAPLNLPAPDASPSYQQLEEPLLSTEQGDLFADRPLSAANSFDARGLIHRGHVSGGSMPPSEWEGDFTGEEQLKLESRVNFFDGHVNDIVGGILAARLGPLETSLDRIQHALVLLSRGTPSSRREPRSNSGELQESDADDEDDETDPVPRRSMSPRRDRRLEQMRTVVLEALATHQFNALPSQTAALSSPLPGAEDAPKTEVVSILKSLDEVKEHLGQSLRLDFRAEDLRNIVEDAVERRMPATPQTATAEESEKKSEAQQARIAELEERLRLAEAKTESEVTTRRAADDLAAELRRKLEHAETKIEVEIMNRSAFDVHVADLEEKLKNQGSKADAEVAARHAAEDRLAEIQRLLRISSEEEMRLREALDERDTKLKNADEAVENSRMRLAVLEAAQVNSEHTQNDLQNRLSSAEAELLDKSQEGRHWRMEAERAIDLSQRQGNDLVQTATELKHMKRVVDTLGTQLEENERLRDSWRSKFVALQEDMARAAREVAEETARHIKREQTLIARHEVLDAKLQAEARTRERLESELERLEGGERQAMRAVSECKRLEALVGDLRTENHKLQQSALRYQAEFEEARESAAREVQRTREAMQAEVESANHEVNVVRGDLEDQMARVRSQLDQVRLDADTAKARLEMLLEEAETTKRTALDEAEGSKRTAVQEAESRHQNDVEDLQARYERQISNVTEDAQRAEQNLLERLSISASKTEHLQDRIAHLEEKLEIAREAAQAAAKAAKASSVADAADAAPLQPAAAVKAMHHGLGLPEKVSPQALRESILVLQEQLQQREQRIEELEHTLAKVDPEADVKIAKRDDEITWLRELLAVRHADLKDIITALGRDNHDPGRVRDAVIRLQANLQMEEQERERAMNGGSAISLPALAANLRDVATPRVAQAVGPLAAAWGSWRKARDSNASTTFSSLSGALLSSPAAAAAAASTGRGPRRGAAAAAGGSTTATPSRAASSSVSSVSSRSGAVEAAGAGDSSFLSGLLTPPTSGLRQTPPTRPLPPQHEQPQPTAFGSTGRRFTGELTGSRRSSRTDNKTVARDVATTPPTSYRRASRGQPVTPPMMRTSAYDSDAQAEEFDDAAFFDD